MSTKQNSTASKLFGKLSKHVDVIQGVIITLLTIGIDQIVEVAAFRCPCIDIVDLSNLIENCNPSLNSCPTENKEVYGYLFIFIPFGILLIGGLTFNEVVWKEITGCCCVYKNRSAQSMFRIIGFALIAPCVWLIVSFLDGDYFACAITELPYKVNESHTCSNSTVLKLSKDYDENKAFSQKIGWIMAIVFSVVAWGVYAIYRSLWRMTYYQSQFSTKYKTALEKSITAAFIEIMQKNENHQENQPPNTEESLSKNMNKQFLKAFKALKQEGNNLKKIFWSNLQKNLDHDFDPTTFNFENMVNEGSAAPNQA